MRIVRVLPLLLLFFACADLKEGADTDKVSSEGGTAPIVTKDGGGPDGGIVVQVDTLATGRNRVGSRSPAGYRPWRAGIAVRSGRVLWVESGTAPGLYSVASEPCATPATCAEKEQSFTRPSAFAVSATHLVVADVNVIKRIPFADPKASETVASHTGEVVNLATEEGGAKVFWTAGTEQPIRFTTVGGTTSSPVSSNGTPVSMAVAGGRLFWVGVDISGQSGAMQSIGTNGSGGREVSRFANGFSTMGGNGTYLYYAKSVPAEIHRYTVASGKDELVDRDAFGATDFAVDDSFAYWTEPGESPDYANGRVRRVAHDSKVAEEVAVAIPYPVALAVEGNHVYVASAGTTKSTFGDGKILKLTISNR